MNLIKKHRQEERRRQYKNDIMEESEFVVISLFAMESSSTIDDAISGEELIAEDTSDIVEDIFRKFELERLRRALAQLSDDEYQLIYDLFLQENPPSERFYSRAKGIPQKTVNCRKLAIFKKIKNILQFSSLK
jgi:DNA-directed RNA polymerase specialized sigma24 family protein